MRTNIVIDETLTDEAFSLTGLKTKRELVEFALKELIHKGRKAKQRSIADSFVKLHQLKLDADPFPTVSRKNRQNPFADDL